MKIPEEGILLLVDKPVNWTSFDVVNKLRSALRIKKIGHAGTLDPLATGLLLIGVGKYTKKLNELQGLDKVYEGVIEIGKTTPSYDLETDFDSNLGFEGVRNTDIEKIRISFTGDIEQIPPSYSAVKINGERAYSLARQNIPVDLKPRKVTIHSFEISLIDLPEIHFRIHCTKGTYIRSIASDFGKKLGVGGYLKKLRRISIGNYIIDDASKLKDLIKSEDSK